MIVLISGVQENSTKSLKPLVNLSLTPTIACALVLSLCILKCNVLTSGAFDRRIVIKLLVTYFQRNHSREVCILGTGLLRLLRFINFLSY